MPEPVLKPLSALAELLLCSERTARRRLVDAMAADPGLRVVKRGRTLLLTEEQMTRVIRALEWRPALSASKLRTAQAWRPRSAQERVRERFERLRRERKSKRHE